MMDFIDIADVSRKMKYEDILSIRLIKEAAKRAALNKAKTRSDLRHFMDNFNTCIEKIYKDLLNRNYTPSGYHKFKIYDRKPRIIYGPSFRDSVVQQLLYAELYPRIEKYIIKMNTGCRKENGLRSNMQYVRKELERYDEELYYIHFDVRKFFYSLKHDLIIKKFRKLTNDKDVLELIARFLPPEPGATVGIPIGNLLSQIIGLFILNDLDHFIKRDLKVKSYIRYVDDFLLIGLTKERTVEIRKRVKEFLKENLDLELSKELTQKIKHGVNFCGYRVFNNKILTRKKNIKKFVNSIKHGNTEAIVSLLEYANKTSAYNFYKKLLIEYSNKYDIILPLKVAKKIGFNYSYLGEMSIETKKYRTRWRRKKKKGKNNGVEESS